MLKAIKRNYFSLNPPQVDTLIFWLLDTSLISDNKSQHLVVGPLWHTHYFPFSSVFESSYLCLNLILSLQILSHVLASFYLKTLSTLGCWITKRKKKHYATRFGIRKDFFRVIMILSMAPFIYTSEEKYNTRLLKSYIAKRWKHSSIFTSVGWDQTLKIDYGMTSDHYTTDERLLECRLLYRNYYDNIWACYILEWHQFGLSQVRVAMRFWGWENITINFLLLS